MLHFRLISSICVVAGFLLLDYTGALAAGESTSASSSVDSSAYAGDRAVIYRLDPASSSVRVLTGSSGALGFLGHDHVIVVPSFSGEARIDTTEVRKFALAIEAPADSLQVIEEDDADTRRKIEKDMKQEVLETPTFPIITLRGLDFHPEKHAGGKAAVWGEYRGRLQLQISLHGVVKTFELPIHLEIDRNQLRARGQFAIKHSDFNLNRKKVAGVVNVAQKLEIEYDVRGLAAKAAAKP
jgi:hypothetical protein